MSNRCGACKYFIDAGDYDLCCQINKRRLCYPLTEACDGYVELPPQEHEKSSLEEKKRMFEEWLRKQSAMRDKAAKSAPEINASEGEYGTWVSCLYRLPAVGQDVILVFNDNFHTHPDWPKIAMTTAWRCNVTDENKSGEWALTGRLYNHFPGVVDIRLGIAWMALPEMPKGIV